MRFLMFSVTLGFVRFSAAIAAAVFGEYPARMAACVAFRSMRYSSQKRRCFSVSPAKSTILSGMRNEELRLHTQEFRLHARGAANLGHKNTRRRLARPSGEVIGGFHVQYSMGGV